MKTFILKAGTKLYHGTDVDAKFRYPRGPAWFCLDHDSAFKWAGWASPPEGYSRGEKRVLVFVLKRDVELPDTVLLADWEALAEQVCGEPEPYIWTFAKLVRKAGLAGWYGKREVMLSRPRDLLDTFPRR